MVERKSTGNWGLVSSSHVDVPGLSCAVWVKAPKEKSSYKNINGRNSEQRCNKSCFCHKFTSVNSCGSDHLCNVRWGQALFQSQKPIWLHVVTTERMKLSLPWLMFLKLHMKHRLKAKNLILALTQVFSFFRAFFWTAGSLQVVHLKQVVHLNHVNWLKLWVQLLMDELWS